MVSLTVTVRPHRRERMAVLLPHWSLQVIKAVGNSEVFEGAGDRSAAHPGEQVVLQFLISGRRRRRRSRGAGGEVSGPPGEISLSPGPPGPLIKRAHTAGSPDCQSSAALSPLTVAALRQQTPPLLCSPEPALLLVPPAQSVLASHHQDLLVIVGAAPDITEPRVVVITNTHWVLLQLRVLKVCPQVGEYLLLALLRWQWRWLLVVVVGLTWMEGCISLR